MPKTTVYHVMLHHDGTDEGHMDTTDVYSTWPSYEEAKVAAKKVLFEEDFEGVNEDEWDNYEEEPGDAEGGYTVSGYWPDGGFYEVYIQQGKVQAPRTSTGKSKSSKASSSKTAAPAASVAPADTVYIIVSSSSGHHTEASGPEAIQDDIAYVSLLEANKAARKIFQNHLSVGETSEEEEKSVDSETTRYSASASFVDGPDQLDVRVVQLRVKHAGKAVQGKKRAFRDGGPEQPKKKRRSKIRW